MHIRPSLIFTIFPALINMHIYICKRGDVVKVPTHRQTDMMVNNTSNMCNSTLLVPGCLQFAEKNISALFASLQMSSVSTLTNPVTLRMSFHRDPYASNRSIGPIGIAIGPCPPVRQYRSIEITICIHLHGQILPF